MNTQRLKTLQKNLVKPILIKKKENLYYLTGRSFDYRAEEYLLVTKKDVVGFGSGLETMDWIKKSDRLKNLKRYIGRSNLDIEYGFTYGEGEYLKYKGVKAKPFRSVVDVMRQVKDADELGKIRKSMQIVEKVFALVKKEIVKPGMTEVKLAKFIQSSGLKLGAEDVSFPAIVASGANAAIPHHVPSEKKLKAGESIILDFGFKYQNYCSDFTRTVFLKTVPKKLELAYNQVEKAYNECLSLRVQPKQSSLMKDCRVGQSKPWPSRNDSTLVLIDGKFKIPDLNFSQEVIIDGDAKILSIAAASIIAKVYRDGLMKQFDEQYPNYQFGKHKGYATAIHRTAIKNFGLTPLHRLSFCGQYL